MARVPQLSHLSAKGGWERAAQCRRDRDVVEYVGSRYRKIPSAWYALRVQKYNPKKGSKRKEEKVKHVFYCSFLLRIHVRERKIPQQTVSAYGKGLVRKREKLMLLLSMGSWRGGSAVKLSACWSCRGCGFRTQHPGGGSRLFTCNSRLERSDAPFWPPRAMHAPNT